MPRRADIIVGISNNNAFNNAGTNYVVQTPSGVLYVVFISDASLLYFRKSVDGGLTWSVPTAINAVATFSVAIWYDRWSGISAGLIHLAYTVSGNSDTLYRTINTESSDALSTETTIFAGTSTASGGWLSITRSRGGNVYCYTCIDAGAEGGFFRLPNANVPNGAWDAAKTNPEALATQDQAILAPGFAADNQDIMCVFWDASANEISRYIYDDSANTWAETSIAASMTDAPSSGGSFPGFAVAVDLTNSRLLLVAWSATDAANADLRCWTVTESSITETSANVVLNSTDDQAMCGITIDLQTGYWWVFYCGKSDGSETYPTALRVYGKVSTDGGATWSAETLFSVLAASPIRGLFVLPRHVIGHVLFLYHNDTTTADLRMNIAVGMSRRIGV